QTREHLAILELLDVRHAIVALTKADLVDDDWLALVTEDVRDLLKPTHFADAEIIPTSVTTGSGLGTLRETIDSMTHAASTRTTHADVFRLPIDRAFTVKGTGTVVTGT